jgi:hypothetical protein
MIQFLVAECERPDSVEERLLRVCGEATVVEITVPRWVTRTIETNIGTELRDRPRSDRPYPTPLTVNIRRLDEKIRCDLRRNQ